MDRQNKRRRPVWQRLLKFRCKFGWGICPRSLLDFRFLELNVFFRDRVILAERQFFSLRAGILLRSVEESCVCRRQQFDLDGGSLGHCRTFPVVPLPIFQVGRMSYRLVMKLLRRGIAQAACIVKLSRLDLQSLVLPVFATHVLVSYRTL